MSEDLYTICFRSWISKFRTRTLWYECRNLENTPSKLWTKCQDWEGLIRSHSTSCSIWHIISATPSQRSNIWHSVYDYWAHLIASGRRFVNPGTPRLISDIRYKTFGTGPLKSNTRRVAWLLVWRAVSDFGRLTFDCRQNVGAWLKAGTGRPAV